MSAVTSTPVATAENKLVGNGTAEHPDAGLLFGNGGGRRGASSANGAHGNPVD